MDEIIESYIDNIGLIDCQINSFNDFILNRINNIVEEENTLTYEYEPGKIYKVVLQNVFIDKPSHITEDRVIRYITPNEARIRDLNYESNICVDLHISNIENGIEKTSKIIHRQPIAKIPIMINSISCNLYGKNKGIRVKYGECDADPGGYFIINGKERVIIAQERKSYNDTVVLEKNGLYSVEIRSMSNETGHSVLLRANYSNNNFYFNIPNIDKKVNIPIGVIFKCFDLDNDDIFALFKDTKYCRHIIQNSFFIETKEEALKYLAQFSTHAINEQDYIDYSTQIVNYELLPHISLYPKQYKILFLRNMIIKLINTIDGKRMVDDRDNLSKKRIESTGILISELFRTVYKNYIRKIQFDMKTDILNTLSKHYNVITKDIRLSFATGNWGSTRNSFVRNGVSQVLCRLSYSGMVSHLRRTNIQIGKEGKNSTIRQLHQSHAFFFCCSESPEGAAVGIVKNLALTVSISNKLDIINTKNIIQNIEGFNKINSIKIDEKLIYVNGQILGSVDEMEPFLNTLFDYRDNGIIHKHVSIVYNKFENNIYIFTEEGRLIRPLINIKNMDKLVKNNFNKSLANNSIVYRDVGELEMEVVAMTPKDINKHTKYLEIHPCLMLGLVGNIIPFPDHNQAPRNVYYASMAKQVIGLFANNYNQRVDTCAHVLHYPQLPIVDTKISKISGIHDQAFGVNAIVAVACYNGFN